MTWTKKSTLDTIIATGSSAALTAGSGVLSSTVDQDAAGDEHEWGEMECEITFATAPTVDTLFRGTIVRIIDATAEFSDDNGRPFHGTLPAYPVRAVTTLQRFTIGPFRLPPDDFQIRFINGTNQTISAGWEVKLRRFSKA